MKIEIAIKPNGTTKDKGDLLEKMSKDFLSMQNFEVEEEVRITGVELDLLCKHKTNPSKIIYVECKAYEDKKIQADVIKSFCGTKTIKKYQEAWLICISELGKEAKGLVEEIKKSDSAKDYFFYTPDKLIQAFVDSGIICYSSVAKQKIIDVIDDENKIDDGSLFITEYGRFWVFKYNSGGIPTGVLVTSSNNGNVIREESLLNNLRNLNSSFKNLNFLQVMEFKDNNLIKVEPGLNNLLLLPSVVNEINEVGIRISHPKKNILFLNDFFIFPDLEDVKNENEIINSRRLLNLEDGFRRSFILGGEISGKTTLARIIQKETNASGIISIYLKAEQIKKSDFNSFLNHLLTQFKKVYSNNPSYVKLFEELLKSDRSNVLIIIDDFELLKIKNESARSSFLEMLKNKFDNLLIFANDSLELEFLSGDGDDDSVNYFRVLRIKQLGHLRRDELIEKWLTIGGCDDINNDDLLNRRVEIASKINLVVGTNFVPTYPFYMLTMLQLIEDGASLKLQGTSRAELYRYLINQSLGSVNVKPEDLDFFHTYLSFFAFHLFKNKIYQIPKTELVIVYENYCQEMEIGDKFNLVHDTLIKAKLIKYENDSYKFNHNYSYYYFVAKYLSDNISNPQIVEEIDNIIEEIYKNEFANIIMFFIYHAKHSNVIDKILEKSYKLFSEVTPHSLSIKEVESINNLICREIKLSIDDKKTCDRRKEEMNRMDKIETKNIEVEDDENVDNILFKKINLATKIIEILGQIVINYYGSINKEKKTIVIDEICSLGMRSLRALLDDLTNCIEGIKNQVEKTIDKKNIINAVQQEKSLNELIYRIEEMFVFIFIKKICDSLSCKKLFISTDKIAERNNNPVGKIISTGVRLNFPKEFNLEKMPDIDRGFDGNYLAKRLLRLLTIEHLYKFEVDYKIKQKVCDKLDIKVKRKLIS